MFKRTGLLMGLLLGVLAGRAAEPTLAGAVSPAIVPGKKTVVYVIPVKEEINRPTLYILRRGLKCAALQRFQAEYVKIIRRHRMVGKIQLILDRRALVWRSITKLNSHLLPVSGTPQANAAALTPGNWLTRSKAGV